MRIWHILRLNHKSRLKSAMLILFVYATCYAKIANVTQLEASIIKHEGVSQYVYVDTLGYSTIGIGRNVSLKSGRGLSPDEMLYLLRNDIRDCENGLSPYSWYTKLNNARKDAMVELCFNLGLTKLLKFKNTIYYLDAGNYNEAARHMLMSSWAKQVGPTRSGNLSRQIRTGKYS